MQQWICVSRNLSFAIFEGLSYEYEYFLLLIILFHAYQSRCDGFWLCWVCVCVCTFLSCGTLTLQSIYIPLKIGWRIHCIIKDYETLEIFTPSLTLHFIFWLWNSRKINRQQHRMSLSPHIFWQYFLTVVVVVIVIRCLHKDLLWHDQVAK